ncbi:hypothetical protein [Kribbella karoonensis]|uniref:Lipoprotein n=1 Tax=Kribbella karoonensis TaxID=324851 RepID=A0ABP4PDZ8_9ACTN
MPRRPVFLPATAALCALTALTACQGSPEAGHPNTTPTSNSPAPTSTPTTPASPTTPTWTSEEQAAITAAKSRYISARAAIDTALNNPPAASKEKLLRAGTGGKWLVQVLTDVQFNLDRGWYADGKASVEGVSVASVNLKAEQPEVRLNACLDTSRISLRYQATRKPVPVGPGSARRHKVQAQVTYTAPVGQSKKAWFLMDETDLGSC